MRRHTLSGLVALLALVAVGCSGPDRSASSQQLAEQIGALPGIGEARDSYTPDTLEFNESTQLLAFVAPGATAEQACAAVATFIESFPDTDIEPDQSGFEVRDESGDPTWSFTMAAAVTDARGAAERCVLSWQARAIPRAYAVRARVQTDSDLARPLILVNFQGTEVRTPRAGLELARENVPSFDEFEWEILNICGEQVCEPR